MAAEPKLEGLPWLREAVKAATILPDGNVAVDTNTWNILCLYALQDPAEDPLRTVASILLTTVRRIMPEVAMCGHDRRWLLGLLADVEEALPKRSVPDIPGNLPLTCSYHDKPLIKDPDGHDWHVLKGTAANWQRLVWCPVGP